MKIEQKNEARRLRQVEGYSINSIAKQLGVSKGSVSRWVRDIQLTSEQQRKLEHNFKVKNTYEARLAGSKAISKYWATKREECQLIGRKTATKLEWLHVAGCMLYWAEGWKRNNKNQVIFSNSDLNMLRLFLQFLQQYFNVTTNEIHLTLNCYTDIHSLSEIEDYWLSGLSLPRSCLKKGVVDCRPKCTQRKVNGTLPYGTCRLAVYNVEIIQQIYGAIQEFSTLIK